MLIMADHGMKMPNIIYGLGIKSRATVPRPHGLRAEEGQGNGAGISLDGP